MAVGLYLALFLLAFLSGSESDTSHHHPWEHNADIHISIAPKNNLKEVIKLLDHRSHVLHQSNLRDEKKISVKQDRSLTMYINSLTGIPNKVLAHLPWHLFQAPAKEKDYHLPPMVPDSELEHAKEEDENSETSTAESSDEDSSGKELEVDKDSSESTGQQEYSEKLLDHVVEELREHSVAKIFTDLENIFQGEIGAAYFESSKYLSDVPNRNNNLLDDLEAMRCYLLLGQGDFIRHLMDLLKDFLGREYSETNYHSLLLGAPWTVQLTRGHTVRLFGGTQRGTDLLFSGSSAGHLTLEDLLQISNGDTMIYSSDWLAFVDLN